MSGRKNLWGFVLTLLVLAGLFYFYGSPVILASIVVLAALPLPLYLGLRRDAGQVSLECQLPATVQVGKRSELRFVLHRRGILLSGRCAYATVCVHNTLTEEDTLHNLCMPIWGDVRAYILEEPLQNCGELVVTCREAWLEDHLELFHRTLKPFPAVSCTVYPQYVSVDAALEQRPTGSPWEDGPMQNRQGTDQSETFDIREYRPEDDVRSIHWKLSVKEDDLIVRIPGSPEFYDLVVLPNFGLEDDSEQRNAALAYGCAALDQLVRKGIRCCLALPGPEGIVLHQITGQKEFRRAIIDWMRTPLPQTPGQAMRLFRSEYLEHSFSRMLLLNAGRELDQKPLNGMAVTVLAVTEDGGRGMTELGSIRVIELPEKPAKNRTYRIRC